MQWYRKSVEKTNTREWGAAARDAAEADGDAWGFVWFSTDDCCQRRGAALSPPGQSIFLYVTPLAKAHFYVGLLQSQSPFALALHLESLAVPSMSSALSRAFLGRGVYICM